MNTLTRGYALLCCKNASLQLYTNQRWARKANLLSSQNIVQNTFFLQVYTRNLEEIIPTHQHFFFLFLFWKEALLAQMIICLTEHSWNHYLLNPVCCKKVRVILERSNVHLW